MLRIRLQRRGRRKRPIHHIVVADSRKPRDGRIIEDLGRFDNITPKNELDLDRERALHWLKEGAQPTDTVRSIFKKQGIMYEMHLIRWGKSEEEIEEALAEWRENRAEKEEEEATTRKERQQALLEAEEKEFQKQLQKKAEEAAREKAKQEALAAEEEEKKEAEEAAAEEEAEEKEEAAEAEEAVEETQEETEEQAAEEPEEAEETEEAAPEEEEAAEEVEASEEDEESSDETEEESGEEKVSTDMLAKEAIDHIENTPLEGLEGFVPEDEDRVTVQRALEDKKENS